MKKLTVSLFALLLMLPAFVAAQSAHKLQYKMEKGKTYRYEILSDGSFTQTMMGQEMKITTNVLITNRIVIEDVTKDGNIVMLASMDSGRVSTKMPMKDTTISLDNFAGKRTRIVMDKLGNVLKREIVDTLEGGQMASMAQMQLAQFFILSGDAVSSWKSSKTDTLDMMGGKIVNVSDMDMSIQGSEAVAGHNSLKIPFTGKITSNGKTNMMGQELFIEGNGKVSGTFYFDEKAGLMSLSETLTDLDMTMATTGENNMIIPMTQSNKTTVKLLNK